MKYAVVDIGTNSARLMIARCENGVVVAEYKTLRFIRVGEGMVGRRLIVPAAIERTRIALNEFIQIAKDRGAGEFLCFATSAVRDAENKDAFLEDIRQACGIDIDIISGDKEAQLGFAGCIDGFGGMFDIGGGSTEVMTGTMDRPSYQHSFQIGTVRLLQMFPTADEADPAAFDGARRYIRTVFKKIPDAGRFAYTAIGGTATALAAIDLQLAEYDGERVHGHKMSLKTVTDIERILRSKTKQERKSLIGLEENKADVIVFGSMLCSEFMKASKSDSIVVSDSDNLEGYLKLNLAPSPRHPTSLFDT